MLSSYPQQGKGWELLLALNHFHLLSQLNCSFFIYLRIFQEGEIYLGGHNCRPTT